MASALLFTAAVGFVSAAPTAATVFIDNFMSMPAPGTAPAGALIALPPQEQRWVGSDESREPSQPSRAESPLLGPEPTSAPGA